MRSRQISADYLHDIRRHRRKFAWLLTHQPDFAAISSIWCRHSDDMHSLFSSHCTAPVQWWAQDLARGWTLPGLHGYRVVAGWGRPAGVSLYVHPHIRTLPVLHRWIPISASGLCIVQSLSGDDIGLTRWVMPHSNLEVAFYWGWRRACVVLSEDGLTRRSVFECGRCHQGVQQSGGSSTRPSKVGTHVRIDPGIIRAQNIWPTTPEGGLSGSKVREMSWAAQKINTKSLNTPPPPHQRGEGVKF